MSLLQKYIDFVNGNGIGNNNKKKNKDLFFGNDPRQVERWIIDFIIKMKEEEKMSYAAIHNYVAPIIAFYKINDFVLNTRKINKFMPEQNRVNKDRPYTPEEISKLLEVADERMRALILLLVSSGMRIGPVPDLKLKHLERLDYSDSVYKVTIYENTKNEHFSFTTPEATKAIDSYLQMRESYGEKLTRESYLIRESFDIRDPLKAKNPRAASLDGLHWKLAAMARRCHIRKVEHQIEGIKIASMRKEVAIFHGFRKFFASQCDKSKVDWQIRERLLNHDFGLTLVYVKKSVEEMYSEYEKAIDNLTIDPTQRLQKEVQMLKADKSKSDLALSLVQQLETRLNQLQSSK